LRTLWAASVSRRQLCQLEQPGDVSDQRLARGAVGIFVFEVIIAIGERQSVLHDAGQVPRRVFVIDADRETDRAGDSQGDHASEPGDEVSGRSQFVDRRQFRAQRVESLFVDQLLVHVALIEIADLAADGVGRLSCRVFDEETDVVAGGICQGGEGAVVGFVGGDFGRQQPASVDVAVQGRSCGLTARSKPVLSRPEGAVIGRASESRDSRRNDERQDKALHEFTIRIGKGYCVRKLAGMQDV